MSVTVTDTNPHDAAIAAILARIAELDIQIAHHNQLARTDAAIRDELADLVDTIATLARKSRPRKPRAVTETVTPAEDAPVRATVFASVPANDEGDAAEAA
jgi:hypothetical protein